MGTEIFIPMFYLVLLTTVVFLFATSLRLKEIYLDKVLNKEGVDGEEFRHPPFETGSITLKKYTKKSFQSSRISDFVLCNLYLYFHN